MNEVLLTKELINTGLLPRVSKAEIRLGLVEFRLGTEEEQTVWFDQKLRAFWLSATTSNSTEANLQAASLRNIWIVAGDAHARRVSSMPPGTGPPVQPSTIATIDGHPTGSTLQRTGTKTTNTTAGPSKTY